MYTYQIKKINSKMYINYHMNIIYVKVFYSKL